MKVQNFKNLTKVCAKVLEVMFFTCSIAPSAEPLYLKKTVMFDLPEQVICTLCNFH